MRKLWVYLLRALLFALCVAAWELGARADPELAEFLPPLLLILRSAAQTIASGELLHHVRSSLTTFLQAYALAAFIGLTGGVLLGRWRWLFNLFDPPIELLRPLPTPAMIPIAILLFGIDESMRIAITVYACTWPILLNTIDGVRGIDAVLLHTARTFGASPTQLLRYVMLPAALPVIVTGLRISVATSLILMVISEMIGGMNGIGFFILNAQRKMRVLDMFAGIIILGVIGYLFNLLFRLASNRLIHWHHGMTRLTKR